MSQRPLSFIVGEIIRPSDRTIDLYRAFGHDDSVEQGELGKIRRLPSSIMDARKVVRVTGLFVKDLSHSRFEESLCNCRPGALIV